MQSPAQEYREDAGVNERLADVRLHLPPEMNAAEDGCHVDEPVQRLPAAPEAAHRASRRGDGERHQQQECREPGRDVGPLHDVGEELLPVECLVDEQVPEKMQGDVEEGEEPEHAPERLHPGPAADDAQRRDRERREQESQAPDPERVLDRLDRVHAECPRGGARGIARLQGDEAGGQPGGRPQAQQEHDRLGVAPRPIVGVHGSQNQRARSMPR